MSETSLIPNAFKMFFNLKNIFLKPGKPKKTIKNSMDFFMLPEEEPEGWREESSAEI